MNRRLVIGVIIAVVGLGLIILGIFAISRIVRQSFAPLPAPTVVPVQPAKVVVTVRDIALGTVLLKEDLTLIEVPVNAAPRNALNDVEQAIGRITTVHLVAGEMILDHHLADPTNVVHDIGYVIGNDQVLMAFPATDLMSSLHILQRGDYIDLFVSSTQNVPVQQIGPNGEPVQTAPGQAENLESRLLTWDLMQKVELTALVVDVVQNTRSTAPTTPGQAQPTPQAQESNVRAYLLALNPQDALLLKNLIDTNTKFDFVLRSPTSDETFTLMPITTEYIVERFQLKITR